MTETLRLIPAVKEDEKLRLLLSGQAGFGKTYSALSIAEALCPGGKILLLDTENKSAKKYAHRFKFFHWVVEDVDPRNISGLLWQAALLEVDCVIIDSLTHSWHKLLEIVEEAGTTRSGKVNTFSGWKVGTPIQRELTQTILNVPYHVMATTRQKSAYAMDGDDGRMGKITKVGTKIDQRDDLSFEFDLMLEMQHDHTGVITKTRCEDIPMGKGYFKPGRQFAEICAKWLASPSAAANTLQLKQALQEEDNQESPKPPAASAGGQTTPETPSAKTASATQSTTPDSTPEVSRKALLATSVEQPPSEQQSVSATESTSGAPVQTVEPPTSGQSDDIADGIIWNQIYAVAKANGWSSIDVERYAATTWNYDLGKIREVVTKPHARLLFAFCRNTKYEDYKAS